MADDDKPSDATSDQWSAIRLSDTNRFYCFMLGLVSAGFAGLMLWRGMEGAATVAFVILGGVLLLFAIAGVLPRRIKSGDHELEIMQRQGLKETTDNAVSSMSADEIQQFIKDTLEAGTGTPTQKAIIAGRAQEALTFDEDVYERVKRIFGPQYLARNREDDEGYDFRIALKPLTVNVDVRWKLTASAMHVIRRRAAGMQDVLWVISGDTFINWRGIESEDLPNLLITGSSDEELMRGRDWLRAKQREAGKSS